MEEWIRGGVALNHLVMDVDQGDQHAPETALSLPLLPPPRHFLLHITSTFIPPHLRANMSRFGNTLSPNVTPTKQSKSAKSRARREPSGVFSLFQPQQVQQFKEAFQLIDHDKNGWVNEKDLREIFGSLGTCDYHPASGQ